jgi:AraC-like DNA-binding protein
LNKDFSEKILYTEETVHAFQNFVICFWEMQPRSDAETSVRNIIITVGCIDLVVLYDEQQIGYSGMSRTDFNFEIRLPTRSFGVRLFPGAFHQLSRLPAKAAMDTFLPLENVDTNFYRNLFFSLPYEEAKEHFRSYICHLIQNKEPEPFVRLFNKLIDDLPATANELYQMLHFSPRQCQRLFIKHFGFSPQVALCLLRFQKCLAILTSNKADIDNILEATTYYDQSHFIKDFKRNIGLTPLELINRYID